MYNSDSEQKKQTQKKIEGKEERSIEKCIVKSEKEINENEHSTYHITSDSRTRHNTICDFTYLATNDRTSDHIHQERNRRKDGGERGKS